MSDDYAVEWVRREIGQGAFRCIDVIDREVLEIAANAAQAMRAYRDALVARDLPRHEAAGIVASVVGAVIAEM